MNKRDKGMIPQKAIYPLVEAIKRAQEETWESRRNGEITQEHKITSCLATNIRRECKAVIKRHKLNIEVLCSDVDDKGPGVEESIYGADLGITIRLNKNEEMKTVDKVKTVLIQSKLPTNKSKKILEEEVVNMVGVAGAGVYGSFVAVYNDTQTKVYCSREIEKANYNANIAEGETLDSFFKKFFSCQYGKRGLDATKDLKLKPRVHLDFNVKG